MNEYNDQYKHIDVEDLALFALLLLSEEEAAAILAHERSCALCRGELMRVREDLATFALGSVTAESVAIPEGARERFLSKLSPSRVNGDSPASGEPPRAVSPVGMVPKSRSSASRVLPWVSWVGWAVAAACLVIAAGLKQDRDSLRGALATENRQTAQLQGEADKARRILGTLTSPFAVHANLTVPKAPATPAARAVYEQKSGVLLLQASNLAPLPAQKVYELWLIPSDGSAPVATGTFTPDAHGNGSLLVQSLQGATAAKAFGITVEPVGGSASPTLPILLAGAPA